MKESPTSDAAHVIRDPTARTYARGAVAATIGVGLALIFAILAGLSIVHGAEQQRDRLGQRLTRLEGEFRARTGLEPGTFETPPTTSTTTSTTTTTVFVPSTTRPPSTSRTQATVDGHSTPPTTASPRPPPPSTQPASPTTTSTTSPAAPPIACLLGSCIPRP